VNKSPITAGNGGVIQDRGGCPERLPVLYPEVDPFKALVVQPQQEVVELVHSP
jgi:hypothetical protein